MLLWQAFWARFAPISMRRAHSCQAPGQTFAPSTNSQREQRATALCSGQAAVAHLHMAELALDDAERCSTLARMLALMRST